MVADGWQVIEGLAARDDRVLAIDELLDMRRTVLSAAKARHTPCSSSS